MRIPYLFLLLPFTLLAQPSQNIFDVTTSTCVSLDGIDSLYLNNLDSLDGFVERKFIEFNELKDFYQDGRILFTDPFSEVEYTGYPIDVQYQDSANYTWIGEFIDSDEGIFFTRNSSGISGGIFLDSCTISIYPLDSCTSILVKQNYPDEYLCGSIDSSAAVASNGECDFDDCSAAIKIVILVDPDATEWMNGSTSRSNRTPAFISGLLGSANFVFARSGINHRVWGVTVEYDWEPQYNSVVRDVEEALVNDATIQEFRDDYDADLLFLITNYNYSLSYGYGGSVAKVAADPDASVALTRPAYAFAPRWNFAHELGHLFGAQHKRITENETTCPWGHVIYTDLAYSILHTAAPTSFFPGKIRVPNFSNPDIYWSGYPTGDDDALKPSNNAGKISAEGCYVASFKGPKEFVVTIGGDKLICGTDETFEALVEQPPSGDPGQPPYTYEWYMNDDGLFDTPTSGTYLGSGSTYTFSGNNFTGCDYSFIRVVVTSNDNVKSYCVIRVTNVPCSGCPEPTYPVPPITNSNREAESEEIVAFPNPCFNECHLSFLNLEEDEYTFEVINSNGDRVIHGVFNKLNGIDANVLPKGLYIIKLKGKFQQFFEKFIKL